MSQFNYGQYVLDLKSPLVGVVAYNHSRYMTVLTSLMGLSKDFKVYRHGISIFDNIKVFYVQDSFTLRGIRGYELYFHDDWYRRDDIEEIKDVDRANKCFEGRGPAYD